MLVSRLRSIIAAAELDCCVRNENRYFPSAMGTDWIERGNTFGLIDVQGTIMHGDLDVNSLKTDELMKFDYH